ncbi:unnamed protein product [Aphanomyces euteiches]|uniref:Uncharacterized protein n=1 Tax=Aphanomyces euteiches TaxID=100861 RepID=A0A6G0WYH4_9STRA|nr:hypothetical protein Ae201684_010287 [Aphanomyces euteiches]KAH9090672.1 hypothetical protein Ae201684P_014467 [Aphanomyces euteiches]KAH9152747.1 hypothetical protein AeRB84_004885 [Aphanomyces euteiches]
MVLNKWTDDETNNFLAYWNDHMDDYMKQKMSFYQAAARTLGTKEWISVKNRCEHLDRKYMKIKQKMSASGFGVRETDPQSLRATIKKEFKWYYDMDDLLCESTHANPLVVIDACRGSDEVEENYHARDITIPMAQNTVEETEMMPHQQKITGKRKKRDEAKEPSIMDVLLELGQQSMDLERSKLELMQKQFEFEMATRREEMEQRQRQF